MNKYLIEISYNFTGIIGFPALIFTRCIASSIGKQCSLTCPNIVCLPSKCGLYGYYHIQRNIKLYLLQ